MDDVAERVGTGWPRLEVSASGTPLEVVLTVDARQLNGFASGAVPAAMSVLRECDLVVVMVCDHATPAALADCADVVLSASPLPIPGVVVADLDAAVDTVVSAITRTPRSAVALTWHLRASVALPVVDGLVAESATFSLLQGNPEYRAWLATRPSPRPVDGGPRVAVDRVADELRITLTRPQRRNALDRQMRAELVEALQVAVLDPSVRVTLSGTGPVFCAGGDLDEFGSTPDATTSHVVRFVHNVGRELARVAPRATAMVHGACVGAGVEIAAFSGRVVAEPGTTFRLPEVGMGLIPGAGGTVSIRARIGRQRFAWLALTGSTIDTGVALRWGLVDDVR